MKAVTYERYGPPDVLHTADVPKPSPTANEILIRVRAAEVTKADCEMRAFRFAVKWTWLPMRIVMGPLRPRRPILGLYFAGEVAETGAAVSDFAIGDPVFGCAGLKMGAYAEYLAVRATSTIVAKPSNMTFAEAAAVPLGGLNALHFLRLAKTRAGDKVLVNGAGGSIGLYAIQVAKAMGAEVTAVDKPTKEALVRRMGADHFIDYTTQDFADTGQRYDIFFDMVPNSVFGECIGVLEKDGRYVAGNPRLATMFRCFWTNRSSARQASFAFARESREELNALRNMIEDGSIQSIVDEVVPMERIADAHRRVENETRMGAIVLGIDNA